MRQSHTLTGHKDIQAWVHDRRGSPAVARVADRFGRVTPRLAIRFARPAKSYPGPSVDDGVSPVSWTAWLAELDRQQLALRVSDESGYELVSRKSLN